MHRIYRSLLCTYLTGTQVQLTIAIFCKDGERLCTKEATFVDRRSAWKGCYSMALQKVSCWRTNGYHSAEEYHKQTLHVLVSISALIDASNSTTSLAAQRCPTTPLFSPSQSLLGSWQLNDFRNQLLPSLCSAKTIKDLAPVRQHPSLSEKLDVLYAR